MSRGAQYKNTTQKMITYALIGGALVVTASSPAGARGLVRIANRMLAKKLGNKEGLDESEEERVRRGIYNMKRKGYVKEKRSKDGLTITLELTKKGREVARGYEFVDLRIAPQKWDGKWRFVMFDIPEKSSYARGIFRDKLKRMGFFQVQKSVWVHPYQCEAEMDLVAEFLGIKRYILVFTGRVNNEKELREYFQNKGYSI